MSLVEKVEGIIDELNQLEQVIPVRASLIDANRLRASLMSVVQSTKVLASDFLQEAMTMPEADAEKLLNKIEADTNPVKTEVSKEEITEAKESVKEETKEPVKAEKPVSKKVATAKSK